MKELKKGLKVLTITLAAYLIQACVMERRRMLNGNRHRREGDLPALLRIPLCAGLMDLILNIVLCAYLYLTGVELGFIHIARALLSVLYTGALSILLMFPTRYFLGMYPHRKKRKKGGELL